MTFTVIHIILALLVGFLLGTMFGLGLHLLRSKSPQSQNATGQSLRSSKTAAPSNASRNDYMEASKAVSLDPIVDGYDTVDSSMPSTRLNLSHTITPDIEEDTEDHDQELDVAETEENLATQLLDRNEVSHSDILKEFPIPSTEDSFTQTSTKSDAFDPFDEMESESLDDDTHETHQHYEDVIDEDATFVMPKKSPSTT